MTLTGGTNDGISKNMSDSKITIQQQTDKIKRKNIEISDKKNIMKILPLGAGNEVGRSCIVVKFKGKTIMLDCGVHPGYSGHGSLPYFDGVNASNVDLLLITHFHIDHVAALPNFTEKTSFKGRIFMTHPTKAVMQMMLRDFLRVSNISVEDQIYDDKDLNNCVSKVEIIDFHQEKTHNGIKFTAYNAGHVLGACMYLIEIAGVKLLYTGDYSLESDRHLMAAEIPNCIPDILIVESTYGVQVHQSVVEREARFTGQVENIVKKGGNVLIPVFALGRTQELLLILDEHWKLHKELQHVPIYFASKLAAKALRIYQTYINMMNERIRNQIAISNPFQFDFISNLKSLDDFQDNGGPCVVMASPGMLQSGVSRQLFERWCPDRKNACIIAGYVVEGTLAKKVLSEPSEITGLDGRIIPMNCSVDYISFSAHADFVGTSGFIEKLTPPHIILVHGEKNEMLRLRSALEKKFNNRKSYQPSIYTPSNMTEITFSFYEEKNAKPIGSIGSQYYIDDQDDTNTDNLPTKQKKIKSFIVEHNFHANIIDINEISSYTNLILTEMNQKQHIPYVHQPFHVFRTFVKQMFQDVKETKIADKFDGIVVLDSVIITYLPEKELIMEWMAGPVSDMIADSIVALAMQAQASPASFMISAHPTAACPCNHSVKEKSKQKLEQQKLKDIDTDTNINTNKISNEKMKDLIIENPEDMNDTKDTLKKENMELDDIDESALHLIIIYRYFKEMFGEVSIDYDSNIIYINAPNGKKAEFNHLKNLVISDSEELKHKVIHNLNRIKNVLSPVEF